MPRRSKTSTSKSAVATPAIERLSFWQPLRTPLERWFEQLPLPNINPDLVSVGSVVLAFAFVVAVSQQMYGVSVVFLLLHLFLDGADGAIARRFRLRKTRIARQHGTLMDVFADRLSEAVIFLWPGFFWPWFPLFVLNVALSILSIRFRKSLVLPVRAVFAAVFIVSLVF